jgi:probable DNA repair protein
LSPAQERLVWEDIIRKQDRGAGLLRPAAAAEAAQSAFALYTAWQLCDHPLTTLGGDETQRFLGWLKAFEEQLAQRQLLSAGQLLPLINAAFEQDALPIPPRLLYSGFDSLSPAQAKLFDTLRARGCAIEEHQGDSRPGRRQRTEAADRESEIRLAAAWARGLLQADPGTRIGIVSVRISQQRRDLERLFTEILSPAVCLSNSAQQTVFNISLGEALSERPLVAHALLALHLLRGPQPLNAIGQVLRSPFIGGHAEEWERRALFDAALREDGLPMIDLQRLSYRLERYDPDDPRHCPDLLVRLQALQTLRRELPASDTPNHWAGHFQTLLAALGWPGDHSLDSREFQQRERMQRVFSELAELGKVRPQMQLGEALNRLGTLATEALFQAKSPPAPIQILGPLEAVGMDFDAIWLLGMDDQNWPPTPHPNPLLPVGLQRELQMPHASAARELAFATSLTERLAHSATNVVASHARSDAEREQRPSPLVCDWPVVAAEEQVPQSSTEARDACARVDRLEPLPAARGGSAPAEQRGGAALLAAQANCPFSAIARFRLRARPLEEPSFAPDGALIGTLIHELLQRVWHTLKDSETLAQHDAAALQALVGPLAGATLDDIGRRRPDLFTPRFRALEAARLTRLVVDWLELERRRSQAFRVQALEQEQTIELEGLLLSTRADRVDQLADGSLAVIDYKTGRSVSNEGWFDERLTEPQLPLYCLHGDGAVNTALLARVRSDGPGCAFVGLSADEDFAPGVETPQDQRGETDWSDILAQWQQALGELSGEIRRGRADATPSIQACRYCALGALCRVQEMLMEDNGA